MKKTKKILIISLAVFAAIIAVAGFFGYHYYQYIYADNTALNNWKAPLYIPTGSDYDDVLQILEQNNFLKDIESFKWVAEKKGYDQKVKPGRYVLESGMSNNDIVNLLRSGRQSPVQVTFNSVRTLNQLAGKVGSVIETDSASLSEYFKDTEVIKKSGFNEYTYISLFIPNTYEFYWTTTAEQFTKRMIDEYNKFWTDERKEKASEIGLSQFEVSTLASIVEQETQKKDEKSRIAGVYMNRLKKDMRLEADPTVIFAIGDFSIQRVLFKHLEYDSPYNTYLYAGLPPGPICIPSVASIDAVLNYEKHDYLFFCAKEDFSGYHNFAKTSKQHSVNARKFHNALRENNIR